MRGDRVKVDDIVEFRGQPRRVVRAWKREQDAPKGIPYPVGLVLELEPPSQDNPDGVHVHLGWPVASPAELQRGPSQLFPRHDDDETRRTALRSTLALRLVADLEAFPIEAL